MANKAICVCNLNHHFQLMIAVIFSFSFIVFGIPVDANTVTLSDGPEQNGFQLLTSDSEGVVISYNLKQFQSEKLLVNGETMQQISLPGVIVPRDEGCPNLPGLGYYVAIPQGAGVNVEVIETKNKIIRGVQVAPAPKIPKDTDPPPLKYSKRSDIYSKNAVYPGEIVTFSSPMKIRGVDSIIISLSPFQWNPISGDLIVHQFMKVKITFIGGNGHFGENRLRSRFFEPMLQQLLINYTSLPAIDFDKRIMNKADEYEYVIIIPDDPDFLTWATVVKDWRTKQGITTGIFDLTTIGSTASEIEDFVDNAYNTWSTPPVAVLLMSDYPNSAKTYGITAPEYSYYISDNIYADVDEDQLPDINFARMTAQNATHLETMVNKFINYEGSPVTDAGFYDSPVAAGGWQSDRWFILCTEIVYGFWHNILGKNPIREYAGASSAPSSWSSNSNTYLLLEYFGPNGLGYVPATPAHLTDWGGNATRINNDINNGTFIILHRDHGEEQGWSDPSYHNSDLSGLSNGNKLPFVFSINCLTGIFDYGSECFVEAFHRMDGGALGLVGATEVSYSFVNDTYVFGMMDSLWPDFDPGNNYIPLGEQELRPGFASVSGKYYLEASNWPSNPTSKDTVYYLFHVHGDAFTTLYSEVPQIMYPVHDNVLLAGLDFFTITAPDGALIGLTVDGSLIGRGEGTGAPDTISIPPQYPPAEILVTITKHNYYRYTATVPVIPPSGPYVIYDSLVIQDSMGNNNGQADYNETFNLDFTVKNVGNQAATDVTVTITPPSGSGVTVGDNTEFFGTVPSGMTVTQLNAYEITFPVDIADMSQVVFDVASVSPIKAQWDSSFAIQAHAPNLSFVETSVDDSSGNNNGRIDPGETAIVTITIENEGSSDAIGISADLETTFPGLSILQPTVVVGTVAAQSQVMVDYTISADAGINSGSLADFTLDLTGSGGYAADTLDFQLRIGNIFALIFEPDPSPLSGDVIETELQAMNKSTIKSTSLPSDISQYDVIFVLLGIYSNNYELSSIEGNALATYLDNGGRVYMEGGDTWYYDTQTAVHPYFHINAIDDGSYTGDLANVLGLVGTFTQSMQFGYTGENSYIDHIEPLADSFQIFRNSSPDYGIAVCYDNGTYKTIGASFEFGGLSGDQGYLLYKYLEFFGLYSVPTLSPMGILVIMTLLTGLFIFFRGRSYRKLRKSL